MNDKLPWESQNKKWIQNEQAEVSPEGEPQIADPSEQKELPPVAEMQEAQEDVPVEPEVVEETITEYDVTVESTPKFSQPEVEASDEDRDAIEGNKRNGEPLDADGDGVIDGNEGSSES